MDKNLTIRAVLSLFLVAVVVIHGAELGLAQKPKPKRETPAELEKKLLTVPAEPLDQDWQTTWQKHLLISFLNDRQAKRLAIGIANNTPCTIKILSTNVDALVKNGRGKSGPPWDIPPKKKLYAAIKPGLQMALLKNNLAGSVVGAVVYPADELFHFEVIPNTPNAKPLELAVVYRYGEDLNGQYITGDYFLCRPEDRDQVLKEIQRR